MLTELEKQLVKELQSGLPLVSRPFAEIGRRLGLSEEAVLEKLQAFKDSGHLKRLGAAIRHQRVGFAGNALVAWRVPEDRLDEVGRTLAGFKEITHCYQRVTRPGWPYNLYTMVHKPTRDECAGLVRRLAEQVGVDDYLVLFSDRELKRTSMTYFAE